MRRKKQNAVRQDVKESAREAASRLAGKGLCSDLNQWSLEGGTCLKIRVSQCVLWWRHGRVRGRGDLDPFAASEMLQMVRFSLQHPGSPPGKGHLPEECAFYPAVAPRAGSRLSLGLCPPDPASPCCLS